MRFLDQRCYAMGALLTRQPSTHLADQRRRDSMASSLGCDGESIDVAAPSIPSTDHGADNVTSRIDCDNENRITFIDRSLQFIQRIGNAGRGIGAFPKLEHFRAIRRSTDAEPNRIAHEGSIIHMRTRTTTVLYLITLLALALGRPVAMAGDIDGIMMAHGKMMMMKMGKPAGPMTSDMTMSNGTKVTTAGLMIMRDGTKLEMKDSEMMMMDGKIMEGGKATGMANQ
jgi:hypothetical protein